MLEGVMNKMAMVVEVGADGARLILERIRNTTTDTKTINFVQSVPIHLSETQTTPPKWLVLCHGANRTGQPYEKRCWSAHEFKTLDQVLPIIAKKAAELDQTLAGMSFHPAQRLDDWLAQGGLQTQGKWRVGVDQEFISIFDDQQIEYRFIPPHER